MTMPRVKHTVQTYPSAAGEFGSSMQVTVPVVQPSGTGYEYVAAGDYAMFVIGNSGPAMPSMSMWSMLGSAYGTSGGTYIPSRTTAFAKRLTSGDIGATYTVTWPESVLRSAVLTVFDSNIAADPRGSTISSAQSGANGTATEDIITGGGMLAGKSYTTHVIACTHRPAGNSVYNASALTYPPTTPQIDPTTVHSSSALWIYNSIFSYQTYDPDTFWGGLRVFHAPGSFTMLRFNLYAEASSPESPLSGSGGTVAPLRSRSGRNSPKTAQSSIRVGANTHY